METIAEQLASIQRKIARMAAGALPEPGDPCACPECGGASEYEPAPPWSDVPAIPGTCVSCDNAAETEYEREQTIALIDAAQRAGRFDLI